MSALECLGEHGKIGFDEWRQWNGGVISEHSNEVPEQKLTDCLVATLALIVVEKSKYQDSVDVSGFDVVLLGKSVQKGEAHRDCVYLKDVVFLHRSVSEEVVHRLGQFLVLIPLEP